MGVLNAVTDPISHVNVWPIPATIIEPQPDNEPQGVNKPQGETEGGDGSGRHGYRGATHSTRFSAEADDQLLVTWRGGSINVSVFVSVDPIDAGTNVRAPDGPGRVAVPRGAGRHYIHLFDPEHGFTVTAERRIRLDGPDNFRDIGGYRTTDGSETRWGRVFRSDRLNEFTDQDHEVLRDLGISTVFDLRSQVEADRQPDRLPIGVRHVHRPMSSDVDLKRGLLERITAGEMTSFTQSAMAAGYLRMLETYANHLAEIVTAVADGERILVHCTAGKDRTGIAAMVLAGLAGVADGDLLDDYEMSVRYRTPGLVEQFAEQVRAGGRDPDDYDIESMLGSPRPVMRRTLDGLYKRWGDHAGYAVYAGLDQATIEAARVNLRMPRL